MKATNENSEPRVVRITHEKGDEDAWVCVCGNNPASAGFYPCDDEGNEIEPLVGSDWKNLYVCAECGRIINLGTLEIVGQNPNPQLLDH